MALVHGEVTQTLPDGATLRWDSTEVDPALRARMDAVIEDSVASLRELLRPADSAPAAPEQRS